MRTPTGEGTRFMAKTLASANALVNLAIDDSVSHMQDCGMAEENLADRVQSILDELKVSARELARKAGLSSESHVGLILAGRVKRPSGDVLAAIAKAGNVELQWLTSGTSPRRRSRRGEPTVETDERYEAINAARGMARAEGYDEAFVSTWDIALDADDQPSADYLWTLCKADYARWRRKGAGGGGDPLADLDAPRKKR